MNYSLNSSSYTQAVKLKGYTGATTAMQANTTADCAKILRITCTGWSRADHQEASNYHYKKMIELQQQYDQLVNDAALQAWGRPYRITDYKISGIVSDEFTREQKAKLRQLAHDKVKHSVLSRAHAHNVRYGKLK